MRLKIAYFGYTKNKTILTSNNYNIDLNFYNKLIGLNLIQIISNVIAKKKILDMGFKRASFNKI